MRETGQSSAFRKYRGIFLNCFYKWLKLLYHTHIRPFYRLGILSKMFGFIGMKGYKVICAGICLYMKFKLSSDNELDTELSHVWERWLKLSAPMATFQCSISWVGWDVAEGAEGGGCLLSNGAEETYVNGGSAHRRSFHSAFFCVWPVLSALLSAQQPTPFSGAPQPLVEQC